MKFAAKIVLMTLCLGAVSTMTSCNNDGDCPKQSFNTLEACEDATDLKLCFCVKDGNNWKAVRNP